MTDPGNNAELKDEVYRQMFRLEAHRIGAEMDLSLALLRAWVAAAPASRRSKERQWLEKICPICLAMIESALQTKDSSLPCKQ